MAQETSLTVLKRFERLHPKAIDLSLDRVMRLLHDLGSPHLRTPPVIHIAGTNGKGSTLAFLRAMFEAGGYRVHAFISPHLRRFHERISLGGPGGTAPIAEEHLIDVLVRAERANAGAPMTFFEITAAAAFLAFAETPGDVLLLETGLGGRLDATNVVEKPLLTIITPISFDHCAYLGNTLQQIAGEKAGILKPGVPCIVARQPDEALRAIAARAAVTGSPLHAAGINWDAFEQHGRLVLQDENALLDLPLPRLIGRHQIDNAGCALAAARRAEGLPLSEADLAAGLAKAVWPGRMERLGPGALYDFTSPGSEIWVDGGHNPAAGEVLARVIADLEERVPCPIHLICGMMATKDAAGFLKHFKGLVEYVVTVPIPGQPNCYAPDALAALARGEGLHAVPAADLESAMAASRALSGGPVRLLITGSLYLAGHVLDAHEHGLAPT